MKLSPEHEHVLAFLERHQFSKTLTAFKEEIHKPDSPQPKAQTFSRVTQVPF